MTPCPVCSARFHAGLAEWHWLCPACGFEASTLEPRIDDGEASRRLDETRREAALRTLRRANFEVILDHLEPLCGEDARMLEVGSAHGWFLGQCAERGLAAEGIEPDRDMADSALRGGLPIRRGLFPDVLGDDERFDAIVFNDVLEHLPDVSGSLAACARHLKPAGLLVVNLPSVRGVFYRTSKLLARIGFRASFERMWQQGLPSPHLSYFSPDGLRDLCHRNHFDEILRTPLPSLVIDGLWERIRFDRRGSLPADALKWTVLAVARPAIALLPADISLQVFRLRGG